MEPSTLTCPDCSGSGRKNDHQCPRCAGSGKVVIRESTTDPGKVVEKKLLLG